MQLCRNVIRACQIGHEKGIFYGDIKPPNVMVDPDTLKVTFIDPDGAVRTLETIAPEDYQYDLQNRRHCTPTEKADIYSLAQGLLIPILSGSRFCRNALFSVDLWGNPIRAENIEQFDNHPVSSQEKETLIRKLNGVFDENQINKLIQILDEMRSWDPANRGLLEDALAVFDKLLAEKAVEISDEEEQIFRQKEEAYDQQLRTLDEILADPDYAIPKESKVPEKELQPNFALRCLHAV